MTIDELIGLLATYPPQMRLVVDGYEDGYDDLSPEQLRTAKIALYTGAPEYVGTHGDVDFLSKEKLAGLEVEKALVLRRTSH